MLLSSPFLVPQLCQYFHPRHRAFLPFTVNRTPELSFPCSPTSLTARDAPVTRYDVRSSVYGYSPCCSRYAYDLYTRMRTWFYHKVHRHLHKGTGIFGNSYATTARTICSLENRSSLDPCRDSRGRPSSYGGQRA